MDNREIVNPNEPETLWNRNYILVLILSIFNNSASQMVTPLISKYAISLGAELTLAATIASIMSIVALFFRPISGLISDTYNRKKIILWTGCLMAAAMYAYSLCSSVTVLIVVRVIHGIIFSFSGVALIAFNTTFMPRSRISEGMGWMALSTIVSQSLGPNLGMWVWDNIGHQATFVCASVTSLLSCLVVVFIHYEKPAANVNAVHKLQLESLFSVRVFPYAILMGLFSCGNGLINAFLKLMADERAIPNIAMFFTVYSIVIVISRPFAGRFQDKHGLKLILYPAYLVAAISMMILGRAYVLWLALLAGGMKALGQGCGSPAIQAHCIKMMGKEKAGVVSSTCFIGQDIGNSVAPIIGGIVVEKYGYTTMFTGYAVLLLAVGWSVFFIKSHYDKKKYGVEV